MSETRTVKLGEIAILQSGIAFPKKLQGKTRGKLPFAKVGDISRTGRSKNIYLSGADNYVDEIEIQQLKGKSVPPGAILFAKIGEAIKQNHRVISKQEAFIDNNAMAVIPKSQLVDLHYLYWMLKEIDFYPLASSTTVPSIRKTILEEILILLPSMDEQKRIAQIKNLRHTIEQKRARQRELLSELEKSVFHQMFDNETEKIKLKELGKWHSCGTPFRSNHAFFNGDIPWFTSREIGSLQVEDSAEHISQDAVDNSAAKLIQPGSLLLGMYDTAALKSSFTTQLTACNQAIAFAKLDENVCAPLFIYHAVQLQKDKILSLRRGIRQKNLNLSMIRNIEILYPTLDKQKQFQSIINHIQSTLQLGNYSV